MSLPSLLLLNPQIPKVPSPLYHFSKPSPVLLSIQILKFPRKFYSVSPSLQSSFPIQNDDYDSAVEEHVIGDCLVFEEGAFEGPYLENASSSVLDQESDPKQKTKNKNKKKKKNVIEIEAENLVPDKWREVQAEINITKKERRKIAQELEFNSRVEKKKKGLRPIRALNLEEYKAYREAKLAQLKPLVLDNPSSFQVEKEDENEEEEEKEKEKVEMSESCSERVAPKNPRWAVYGKGFDDVNEFFNSGHYEPGVKNSEGRRKLFTQEEKLLLNRKIPDVAAATSGKWLPLHSLAASGEFYLVDALLKHNVDINALNVDGLTALHKAILCKKQAITGYLLRESANPFVLDSDGASLLHYAVQTASAPAIKLLLLYNVDINLQDNDGWTPLHVAVQARRSDIIKLLLIKGADQMLKNQDGLTPLDLCLYSGRDTKTFELIKLLKQFAKK
ncbi:ankyrin repeat domain-containing protein, chloroplastic [Ricinus communis]|uniref:Aberrant large forked product, putative n=1 Tax=Ricinus communis TaxID=3988 RepID=B9SXC5_RICCO|nr:ankyrin repeat domain-containing protein, chloroplastic [Ricinus communis]EEF31752.1 aberrant large forked product, putative [Ricinus communis]|eukprot:XP_002530644.1 ankyrin repeat domain-containing protein, chloroplastic [Ricinus communis]